MSNGGASGAIAPAQPRSPTAGGTNMTRIDGVSTRNASPLVRLVYRLSRRRLGRDVEPIAVYAHAPGLLLGYGVLEQATAGQHRVQEHLKVLAETEGGGARQLRVLLRHRLPRSHAKQASASISCWRCRAMRSRGVQRARAARARLRGRDDPHAHNRLRRAVGEPARALRRAPAGRADERDRAREHARALQRRLRHDPSGLQRGHGVRNARAARDRGGAAKAGAETVIAA